MSTTVAQFLLNRLTDWGVKRVYGYPGDGINGLLGAFHEVGDRLQFTQTRHEEIASFAACAHAKFTGELGVCMATSGPGAIHLLNGLYDAKLDHQPVLAIVGQQKRMSLGAHYQQEVDLQVLFKDVAAEYCMTIMAEQQAAHVLDQAVRTALASRSPTAIIIPEDVQEASYSPPPRTHGAIHSSVVNLPRPHVVPPRGGPAPGGRGAQRRLAGRDPRRSGREERAGRAHPTRRRARLRRGQGAQRP